MKNMRRIVILVVAMVITAIAVNKTYGETPIDINQETTVVKTPPISEELEQLYKVVERYNKAMEQCRKQNGKVPELPKYPTANAEVNKLALSRVYEEYEGSDRYIKVRTQVSGCADLTMEEIDTFYSEYKAEQENWRIYMEKCEAERKASMAKSRAERAERAAKSAKTNPLNLRALANVEIGPGRNFQWPTEYVCLDGWNPYGVAFARDAK